MGPDNAGQDARGPGRNAQQRADRGAGLAEESLIKRLRASGYSVLKGMPANLAARHKADYDTFGAIVKDAGIEPQ